MKISILNKLIAVLLLWSFISCEKKNWDEYYEKPDFVVEGSTWQVLSEISDYSEFVSLIKRSGYDSILNRSNVNTVLAVKNDALSGVSYSDAELKKILGMHIIPSRIFKESMSEAAKLSVYGKLVKFKAEGSSITANNIELDSFDKLTANGVYHDVKGLIIPKSNLFEALMAEQGLTEFKNFILQSYDTIIDPENNIKIGFDTLNNPIYQEPINYILSSEYVNYSGLQDEKSLKTAFVPSDNLIQNSISGILESRGGISELVAPRLDENHGDTIVGWRYFKKGETYPGDTAILLDNICRHLIAEGLSDNLNSNAVNLSGAEIKLNTAQVQKSKTEASNGLYYILDDLDLPESFYKKEYFFLPSYKVDDPDNPGGTMLNPNIVYNNGAKYSAGVSKAFQAFTNRYTRFDFVRRGTSIDFKFQNVIAGEYDVIYCYYPETYNARIDISYGEQMLREYMEVSYMHGRGLASVPTNVGRIQVQSNGEVIIKVTCADTDLRRVNQYKIGIDYIKLIPVVSE